MMSVRFRKEPVLNYADAQAAAGGERYARLFRHLLNAGIYWHAGGPGSLFCFQYAHPERPGTIIIRTKKFFKP